MLSTRTLRDSRVLLPALLAALALSGCGNQAKAVGDVTPARLLVDVDFTDSSVPPQYHRSWVLLLDEQKVVSSVTDYEDVVGGSSSETPAGAWKKLAQSLPALITRAEHAEDGAEDASACAGGTEMVITVRRADRDGDVTRADAKKVSTTRLSSCDRPSARAIDEVQKELTPLADLVQLPEQARTWAGRADTDGAS